MPRKRVINPKHCRNQVREQITMYGYTVTLTGKYSQEWSIMKESNGKITIEIFPNRKKAREEWKKKYSRAKY